MVFILEYEYFIVCLIDIKTLLLKDLSVEFSDFISKVLFYIIDENGLSFQRSDSILFINNNINGNFILYFK